MSSDDEIFTTHILPVLLSDALLGQCMRLTRCPTKAEDLRSDVMTRAWLYRGKYNHRDKPQAWVHTIARNTYISSLDARRRRDRAMSQLRHQVARRSETFGEQVNLGMDSAAVNEQLGRLPPHFREIIELVDVQGLAYKEAAEVLGVAVGTVMSRLYRARHRLREDLQWLGEDYGLAEAA